MCDHLPPAIGLAGCLWLSSSWQVSGGQGHAEETIGELRALPPSCDRPCVRPERAGIPGWPAFRNAFERAFVRSRGGGAGA